ncbi:MOSC domain-containing protein [Bradyrhizobium manausense]|uniref:MOSC domain-containing protein n=1 Tax=Bradyrhizobium TaxID=374 RepID=UPI001BABACB9|nr:MULTISPECIES: MOSC domain-containing protein [Bradyrhizobium]MBR0828838.1 MOSC domain-containing protein [Bradyrhizobium manausense]UVO33540.1 MOSC domain-containing protein [Bradyrhizobium arachidis]
MTSSPTAEITGLYRYPVKGLSPEPLPRVPLRVGQTLPADRRYAIENGPSGFDPEAPQWLPKTQFLMLMRNERLAGLQSRFEDASNLLTIRKDGQVVAAGDMETPAGRAAIERYFAENFQPELKGPPKVLSGRDHSFSDVARKVVSIINLASVRAIETMLDGAAVHPLRFRANLYVQGWPAWHELDLVGQTLAIGQARLRIVKRIVRCAAVNVDPETAQRDLEIPPTLSRRLGHMDCGIYGEVIADGDVGVGDTVAVEAPTLV